MKIIVFAGGVGSRLWPLSRKNTPKQFGKVLGDQSTLQQTIYRLLPEFKASDIYIATGKHYKKIVQEQLPFIPKDNFIFEPMMRDVGPAIGLVSFLLEKKFPDEPIAILWSDHVMKNELEFLRVLRLAEKKIQNDPSCFIFLAQKPRFANQNCGWIELGKKVESSEQADIFEFKRLIYRPALEDAEKFFAGKQSVWNLGYYITTPKVITDLFKQFVPEMYEKLHQLRDGWEMPDYEKKLMEIYPTLEKISFDDAILVKLSPSNLYVISTDLGWSDVGTWDALKEALSSSPEENVTSGEVLLEDTQDSLIFNYSHKQLCVGIDLEEMIVINTNDVLMVCPKTSVPKIKKLVEKLEGTPHENLI